MFKRIQSHFKSWRISPCGNKRGTMVWVLVRCLHRFELYRKATSTRWPAETWSTEPSSTFPERPRGSAHHRSGALERDGTSHPRRTDPSVSSQPDGRSRATLLRLQGSQRLLDRPQTASGWFGRGKDRIPKTAITAQGRNKGLTEASLCFCQPKPAQPHFSLERWGNVLFFSYLYHTQHISIWVWSPII